APVPDGCTNPSARSLASGAKTLGAEGSLHACSVNIEACLGCGYCNLACAYLRKRTVLQTMLPSAAATGRLRIFAGRRAREIAVRTTAYRAEGGVVEPTRGGAGRHARRGGGGRRGRAHAWRDRSPDHPRPPRRGGGGSGGQQRAAGADERPRPAGAADRGAILVQLREPGARRLRGAGARLRRAADGPLLRRQPAPRRIRDRDVV